MKLTYDDLGNSTFTRDNGETVQLSINELGFIAHAIEKNKWRYGMIDQIEYDEDNLDFSEISKEKLIDLCMDDIEFRYEIYSLGNDIDYGGILFDVAQENGMWRDE